MKLLRVLHISDLHRGSAGWNSESVGDYKDFSVSPAFASSLTKTMADDFIDAISQWRDEHGTIDAIACTGDLGNCGAAIKIEEGASFIKMIQTALRIPDENVLICPGNHDVDREANDKEDALKGFTNALSKNNFTDHRLSEEPVVIGGFPIVVLNTCLGAGEHSLFIERYKQLVSTLSPEDRQRFNEETKNDNLDHLDDCLDIPAVTTLQRQRIQKAVRTQQTNFFIMLSHHSFVPSNSVEIRPYASIIDAGKTLYDLFSLKKNVIALHGHIHFSSAMMSYEPRLNPNLFFSSIGAGLFNGGLGSSVNILEFICSDDGEYVITIVYEYVKNISGFSLLRSYSIGNHNRRDSLSSINNVFSSQPNDRIQIGELIRRSGERERDVLVSILQHEDTFRIDRNGSVDLSDWTVYRL